MSDIQNPYTPPAEPAGDPAPVPEQTPADTDYSAHPVWGKALESIPEMLRPPIYESIRTSEREAQAAIEKARGTDIPQDWRELAAEAAEAGVTVDQLAEAYRGQALLAEQLNADPDAFLAEMQQQVNAMIASGQITRKQGAAAMQQATAAVEETDDLLTPEQRELKEIREWKQQQQAAQREAAQAEQQRQAQAAAEAQQEQLAEQYFEEFDRQMETLGFAQRDAAGALKATIPIEVFQQIARLGGDLIDANPRMTPAQAIPAAITQMRRIVEAAGGKLAPAAAQAQVPVIAGSSAMPGQQPQGTGGPRSMSDRANAALAEALRLAGAGD